MEKRYVSKNGINVYAYKNPAVHGFFISLFLKSGSMYESKSEEGITHFLEHVLVRNVNKRRGMQLYRELDERALEFNASTFSEMVQFFLGGATEHFEFGAEIICELLYPIILTSSELEAERRRVKAEMREDDDRSSLAAFSQGAVFAETSLSNRITGSQSGIGKIGIRRLEAYRKQSFARDNIFFYVTGNFSDRDMESLISFADKIGDLPNSGSLHENFAPVPTDFGNRAGKVIIKNAREHTAVRFNFDIDMKKVRSVALDLLYDILLSGYDSPFFVKMSEEEGIFYDISGASERYRNIGSFAFSYELSQKHIYDAVKMSVDILNSFKKSVLPERRLMKAAYVDNAYIFFDDVRESNFTFAYDNHIMQLGYSSLEERIEAYKSVSAEEIRQAACEIFRPENLTLAVRASKKSVDVQKITDIIKELV